MLTVDEIRTALGNPALSDAEVEQFRTDLYSYLNRALDEYFALASRGPTGCEPVDAPVSALMEATSSRSS